MAWVFLGQQINYLQWIFIGILLIGLFITSAGDSILQSFSEKKKKQEECVHLEFKELSQKTS